MIKFVILFFIFTNSALSNDKEDGYYGIINTAKWTKNISYKEIEDNDKASHYGGAYYLLSDYQQNFIKKISYYRTVKNIINYSGVENHSTFSTTYAPFDHKIYLNKVLILRDDEVIDQTKKVKVEIDDVEGTNKLIFSDRKKITFIIPDVRKGDVIDYSYSMKENNNLFGISTAFLFLEDVYYIKKLHRRVLTSKDKEYDLKYINNDHKPIINIDKGIREYIWEKRDVSAYGKSLSEKNMPVYYSLVSSIQISDQKDYSDIVNHSLKLYRDNIPLKKEVKKFINEIKNDQKLDKEQKILKLIRYVQNDIRYLAVFDGVYGIKPKDPNSVFENKAGDCKGKTMLLKLLLQEIGIKSYPVLVSTNNKNHLINFLPDNLFDHVVLSINYDDKTYWVDPTINYQEGKLDNIYFPDYGFGLKIKKGENQLVKMPENNSLRQYFEVTYDFITSKKDFFNLTVKTYYYSNIADSLRKYLSNNGRYVSEKKYLEYYKKHFKNIKTSDELGIWEKKDLNSFYSIESYEIPLRDINAKGGYLFPYIELHNNIHNLPEAKARNHPYILPYKNFEINYKFVGIPNVGESNFNYKTDNISLDMTKEYSGKYISNVKFKYNVLDRKLDVSQIDDNKKIFDKKALKGTKFTYNDIKTLRKKYYRFLSFKEKQLKNLINRNKSFCDLSEKDENYFKSVTSVGSIVKQHCKEKYYAIFSLLNNKKNLSVLGINKKQIFAEEIKNKLYCKYNSKTPISVCLRLNNKPYLEIKSGYDNLPISIQILGFDNIKNYKTLDHLVGNIVGKKINYNNTYKKLVTAYKNFSIWAKSLETEKNTILDVQLGNFPYMTDYIGDYTVIAYDAMERLTPNITDMTRIILDPFNKIKLSKNKQCKAITQDDRSNICKKLLANFIDPLLPEQDVNNMCNMDKNKSFLCHLEKDSNKDLNAILLDKYMEHDVVVITDLLITKPDSKKAETFFTGL